MIPPESGENTSTFVEEVGEVSHGSGSEDCDEDMLLGRSELDDDLDVVDCANGIWERRRSGVTRGKKLLKSNERSRPSNANPLLSMRGNSLRMCLRVSLHRD